ncbi:hypothetical protein PENVUL_c178G05925, partial [Penicillium vulpinum]
VSADFQSIQSPGPLEIPGPRDKAVKEYGEWQVSNVTDDTLKAAFREICDMMIDNGLDLEQVYKDQDPEFFIGRGIKIGIARRGIDTEVGYSAWTFISVRSVAVATRAQGNIVATVGRDHDRFRAVLQGPAPRFVTSNLFPRA